MAARFSEIEMLRLAEIYKDYDCLWDVKSCFYKNRDIRENAYMEIWRKLNVPSLSIKDVPIKIKNLRTSYHQELKKIDISLRSGASPDTAYKPKVSWFEIVDGYLSTCKSSNNRNTQGNADAQSNPSDCTSDNEHNLVDDMFEEKYHPAEAMKLAESANSVSAELRDPADLVKYQPPPAPALSRRTEDIGAAIERMDRIAERMTRNVQRVHRPGDDEFDSFGVYIATALRALPPEVSILAKTELQKTLSNIQLRTLRQS